MPRATFGGVRLHCDLCDIAAAYLFHIEQNHALVDGNKRAGAVAAFVFLALNGVELAADEDAFEQVVREVAQGMADRAKVAAFLRRHASS